MSNVMRPHHHQLFSSFLSLKSEYELQKCFSLKDLSWVNWKFENIGQVEPEDSDSQVIQQNT